MPTYPANHVVAAAEYATLYYQRTTLGASAASVLISGIPATLRRLTIRWTARGDNAVNTQNMFLRINGDTTSNYNSQETSSVNTAASGTNLPASNVGLVGSCVGASAPAGVFGSGVVDIVGWDSPHSGFLCWTFVSQSLGNGSANFVSQAGGGYYIPAGPYTSLGLSPASGNFLAGSDFQIEGF